MTITYTGRVANARLGGFSRLLLFWKGSIYKLMYKEMLIFCLIYLLVSIFYRLALSQQQMRMFERIALYCEAFTSLIPLSFILGFYVAVVVTRWWNQFLCIPWPDRLMIYVTTIIDGLDEQSRIVRRTVARYMTMASLIVFQATSVSVKKRFPTMDHLIEAGVINEAELKALDEVNTPHGKWWVPFVWTANLIKSTRKAGRISDDYLMKTIIDEMMTYRNDLGKLYSYDWISVPLVYTQVTTLAVYTFFGGCIFGRQFLDPSQNYPGHNVDLYVPVFTILQFFFYMGWLKVAEQLINPFGEDDDDFEMNWIIDRNMQISLLLADDLHDSFPLMEKDMYFGESAPECLPYTKSSISSLRAPFMGSTANLSVSRDGMQVVMPMETIQEEGGRHMGSSPYGLSVSRPASPFSTPGHTRRLHQNLMSGVHSQLSLSRSTLDVIKATDKTSAYKPVVQTLNGSYVSKATSYLEGLMHDPTNSHVEVGSFSSCKGGNFQQRFSRAMESDNNSVCVSIDDPAQTPRDESVGSPGSTDAPGQSSAVNIPPQQMTAAHSVSFSIPSDVITVASSVTPVATPIEHEHKFVVNPTHVVNVVGDAPGVVDDAPAVPPASPARQTRCSTSSEESLMGYESPESNQSTVNSLTPLLQFGIGLASHGHGDAV